MTSFFAHLPELRRGEAAAAATTGEATERADRKYSGELLNSDCIEVSKGTRETSEVVIEREKGGERDRESRARGKHSKSARSPAPPNQNSTPQLLNSSTPHAEN
jgi:hypothetical protein